MATFEIYWDDLKPETQEQLKVLYHENIHLSPLAIIEIEDEDNPENDVDNLDAVEPKECEFVSVWSDGSRISSPAYLYADGSIEVVCFSDEDPDGFLDDEYIIVKETGEEFKVCQWCHDTIVGKCSCDECGEEGADYQQLIPNITKEDVLQVANSVGIEKLTDEQIDEVIKLYPNEQRDDIKATWDLVVEKILYDILK